MTPNGARWRAGFRTCLVALLWLACSPRAELHSQSSSSDSGGHFAGHASANTSAEGGAENAGGYGASPEASEGGHDGSVPIEPGKCPSEQESTDGKIAGDAIFSANPDIEYPVAIWLRSAILPRVPACPDDSARDARCAARDDALSQRQALNVQEVNCVLDALGNRITHLSALWYELPYHLTSGAPVPIGLSFRLILSGAQIAAAASHPFVERVEPAPGTVSGSAFPIPAAPDECAASSDDPVPKLSQLTQIQGQGFQPALIDLDVSERNLPDFQPCSDDDCTIDWERTLLNTREITCLQRNIDRIVSEVSPPLTIFGSMVPGGTAELPPFGQALAVTLVLGQGVTWDEAVLLAAQPTVADIRTYDGLSFDPPPPLGCPPDLEEPIPVIACTDARDPIDSKFFPAALPVLEQATSPLDVEITVTGGAPSCPQAACSTPPCPDVEEPTSWMTAMNLASQRCVRDLIASVGGTTNPDADWLVDSFEAWLTWSQMQTVAAYPTVTSIEPSSSPLN